MMAPLLQFKRDMQFVHGRLGAPMFGRVLRVARDGSWIDVRWTTWSTSWTTRHQPNDPLLEKRHSKSWTAADVAATAPKPDLRLADTTTRHPEGYEHV